MYNCKNNPTSIHDSFIFLPLSRLVLSLASHTTACCSATLHRHRQRRRRSSTTVHRQTASVVSHLFSSPLGDVLFPFYLFWSFLFKKLESAAITLRLLLFCDAFVLLDHALIDENQHLHCPWWISPIFLYFAPFSATIEACPKKHQFLHCFLIFFVGMNPLMITYYVEYL